MKPITMTYDLAMAAGRDAGNRSMRRAGREQWNEDDWNRAAETFAGLWPEPTSDDLSVTVGIVGRVEG
jgi:hypothetical protein